jgi:hypothetical protein
MACSRDVALSRAARTAASAWSWSTRWWSVTGAALRESISIGAPEHRTASPSKHSARLACRQAPATQACRLSLREHLRAPLVPCGSGAERVLYFRY